MQEAEDYAKKQSEAFQSSLQYLINEQNEQKKAAQQLVSQNYTNMINKLNQSKVPLEETYEQNARQAYINKMLAGKQLDSSLSRLGLDTTGFGLSQQLANENQYSANLNQLALDKAQGLREIENSITNAEGQQVADLLNLDVEYANKLNELNKYISEQVQNKYNTEYNRFFTNKQYEDALKQQEIENQQSWLQLNNRYGGSSGTSSSSGSSSYGFGGSSGTSGTSGDVEGTDSDIVDNFGNNQATYDKANYYFKNSSQPRYVGNEELGYSGVMSQDVADFLSKTWGISLDELGAKSGQNIWKTPSGLYYLWDNNNRTYTDLTQVMKSYLRSDYAKKSSGTKTNTSTTSEPQTSPKSVTQTSNKLTTNPLVNASLKGTTQSLYESNRKKGLI